MRWQFTSARNIGDRDEQQDRVAILNSGDAYLLVIADGMGGRKNGANAAQTVIDIARQQFSEGDNDRPGLFLAMICLQAHKAILAQEDDSGSTCVILYLKDSEVYCAHVGDSRMYQFRDNTLIYKTSDHSISQLIADHKVQAEDKFDEQAVQNQLYMCLGGKNNVIPELSSIHVRKGDLLLLCSDGLWNQINEPEMLSYMDAGILVSGMSNKLLAMANKQAQGQSDNISMACAYLKDTNSGSGSGLFAWKQGWLTKFGNRE